MKHLAANTSHLTTPARKKTKKKHVLTLVERRCMWNTQSVNFFFFFLRLHHHVFFFLYNSWSRRASVKLFPLDAVTLHTPGTSIYFRYWGLRPFYLGLEQRQFYRPRAKWKVRRCTELCEDSRQVKHNNCSTLQQIAEATRSILNGLLAWYWCHTQSGLMLDTPASFLWKLHESHTPPSIAQLVPVNFQCEISF